MKHLQFVLCLVASLLFLVSCLSSVSAGQPKGVPKELDEYLNLPDDSFRWEIVPEEDATQEGTILIEMTSQTWHDIAWKHYLLLVIPKSLKYADHAVLYIGGKSIGRKPNEGDIVLGRIIAEAAGMPIAMLFQVPNQPLFGNYVEDALIGETLLKTIATKDLTWPLLFPMTKSALRAMDAVQQALKRERDMNIGGFVVAGASKRGWTTWLTAASGDKRVKAIAPVVIDNLNIRRQMGYQLETWGDYSLSIHDYTERKLLRKEGDPPADFDENLWEIIDPYYYLERCTMPKLLVHGTNDPYWTVDAARIYWDDLPGVKYLLTLPNVGHNLGNRMPDAVQNLALFARHVAEGGTWPKFAWKMQERDDAYEMTLDTDLQDVRVKIWSARSASKEFREATWSSQTVTSGLSEPIRIPKPESGHIAFYVELINRKKSLFTSLTTTVYRF